MILVTEILVSRSFFACSPSEFNYVKATDEGLKAFFKTTPWRVLPELEFPFVTHKSRNVYSQLQRLGVTMGALNERHKVP
jgi:hypothetical protein